MPFFKDLIGALTGRREHIYHAAMLDPHTGAELDLNQIWSMVDELIAAHGSLLPPFDPSPAAADLTPGGQQQVVAAR